MRQVTIFFTILSFLLMPLTGIQAEETDVYADSIVNNTTQVLSPSNALGAPDEVYADFLADDQYIKLDLGEGEEGIGNLTLHLYLLNYGAYARVEFYDVNDDLLDDWWDLIPIGVTELEIPYTGTEPYRYVRVNSTEEEVWKLDAVEVLELNVVEEDPAEEEEETETEVEVEPTDQGRLITLPDDGDPDTQYDSAVYFVGDENKRHAFPNDTVYYSWWEDFDDVEEISAEEMADYPLGANVTVRPGTHLVKLQTSPKVYAVEPGAVLREIMSEEIATDLYGAEWSTRVVDIADGFWGNYTVGEEISAAVHPTGTLILSPAGEFVYLSNGNYYSVAGATWVSLRFRTEFFIGIGEDIFSLYIDGGSLGLVTTIQYPY